MIIEKVMDISQNINIKCYYQCLDSDTGHYSWHQDTASVTVSRVSLHTHVSHVCTYRSSTHSQRSGLRTSSPTRPSLSWRCSLVTSSKRPPSYTRRPLVAERQNAGRRGRHSSMDMIWQIFWFWFGTQTAQLHQMVKFVIFFQIMKQCISLYTNMMDLSYQCRNCEIIVVKDSSTDFIML